MSDRTRKLDPSWYPAIRILYERSGLTQKQIGAIYGVTATRIKQIVAAGKERPAAPVARAWGDLGPELYDASGEIE